MVMGNTGVGNIYNIILNSNDSIELPQNAEEAIESAKESLSFLTEFKELIQSKIYLVAFSLILLVLGWYMINLLCRIVRKTLERSKLDDSVTGFIYSFVKIGLRVILFVIIITTLGVDMTSIIALLTSAAIAVGLALQGSLANLAGGLLLLVMKPFKVGDYIDDGNGHEGTVTSIEVIYTRLRTIDNQVIWIPNGKLADSTIRNSTQLGYRLIDIVVGIDYTEDIDKIRGLLLQTAEDCDLIVKTLDQPPVVFVQEFTASSIDVVLRVQCTAVHYLDAKRELLEMIKKKFDENSVSIPYDHLDVHLY